MKKYLIGVICLVLMIASLSAYCAPETFDIEEMSREELHTLIDRARGQLIKYELFAETDTVLYDDNGIKITFKDFKYDNDALVINTIVENNADLALNVSFEKTYINGWDKYVGFFQSLEPGKKAKNDETVYRMEEVDVYSVDDLEMLEFKVHVVNGETYSTIADSDTITLIFKK